MSNVLEVLNVGKSFKEYNSEFQRISSWFGLNPKPCKEHQILKNINFSIAPGEAVGIVGQNGAGKSTLLKMITGTLKPSSGSINVAGRISAILELGMGFHPDLTGRQNVYHSAGLMGYTQAQVDAVIDELEEFAEVGEYFDQPVRTYSSGMQVRVAFGVATAYRPEILIVDEALSVGDTYFQHKSFSRIREFQEQGTTLLLVSHDRNAIQSACDRAILLEKGMVVKDGDPEEVMDFYSAIISEQNEKTIEQKRDSDGRVKTISGTKEAEIVSIQMVNSRKKEADTFYVGEEVEVRVEVFLNESIDSLVLGCGVKDRLGQMMFGTNTFHTKQIVEAPNKKDRYLYKVKFKVNLGVGSYSLHLSLVKSDNHIDKNFHWIDRAQVFNIINSQEITFVGCMWNEMDFKCERIESHDD